MSGIKRKSKPKNNRASKRKARSGAKAGVKAKAKLGTKSDIPAAIKWIESDPKEKENRKKMMVEVKKDIKNLETKLTNFEKDNNFEEFYDNGVMQWMDSDANDTFYDELCGDDVEEKIFGSLGKLTSVCRGITVAYSRYQKEIVDTNELKAAINAAVSELDKTIKGVK